MGRRHKRFYLDSYLDVLDVNTGKIIGKLADVSKGGLMLMSNTEIECPDNVSLKVVIPSYGLDDDVEIQFDSRLVWTKKQEGTGFFLAGLEIVNPDKDYPVSINELIDLLGFDH